MKLVTRFIKNMDGTLLTPLRKQCWARFCNAFLLEAKWLATGHLPKAEEYLENAIVTTGAHVALAHAFFLVDQGITKREGDILAKIPGIISSAANIVCQWDDLGSAKDENQEGRDGSYVNLYIKEHLGISVQGAREHVMQIILDAWKRLNQESCPPNPFSPCFTKVCLNGARMAPLMYNYDEHQNLPALEEHVQVNAARKLSYLGYL
ncbi:Terpene synthase [Theobroma cacao]|nr:Terpene synthase [Theobroma cacao]